MRCQSALGKSGERALRGRNGPRQPSWLRLGAAALAVLAAGGCGARISTDPLPDFKLAEKIRTEAAGDRGTDAEESATAASPAVTEWGNLRGTFIYDGSPPEPAKLNITKDIPVCGPHNLVDESLVVGPRGGLAHVVIYVINKKVPVHPDYAATAGDQVMFDNEHCRFEPHILPIRLSQTLVLHNSDPVGHNSNLVPLGDRSTNPSLGPKARSEYTFTKAQRVPVSVTCNIHPWMKGYILPRDNPYMAVSQKDGTFEIANLPAVELEFQVWHEGADLLVAEPGWKKGKFKRKIRPGENNLGEIKVSPSLFGK